MDTDLSTGRLPWVTRAGPIHLPAEAQNLIVSQVWSWTSKMKVAQGWFLLRLRGHLFWASLQPLLVLRPSLVFLGL